LVSTAAEPPPWPERNKRRTLVHLPKPFALSSLLQETRGLLDAKGK